MMHFLPNHVKSVAPCHLSFPPSRAAGSEARNGIKQYLLGILGVLFLVGCTSERNTVYVEVCLKGEQIAEFRQYCMSPINGTEYSFDPEKCSEIVVELGCNGVNSQPVGFIFQEVFRDEEIAGNGLE